MKRFIFVMVMAVVALVAYPAKTQKEAAAPAPAPADTVAFAEKLSVAQDSIAALNAKLDDMKDAVETSKDKWSPAYVEDIVAIVFGVSFPFIFFIAVSIVIAVTVVRTRKAKYRMIESAIDHNYELPKELFQEKKASRQDWRKGMMQGIVLFAVGVATAVMFLIGENYTMAVLMTILVLLGLGKAGLALWDKKEAEKKTADAAVEEISEDAQ